MALVFLIVSDDDSDTFAFDATLSVNANLNNEITEYPIESGFDVTKGVIKKSDSYVINGVISDYHLRDSRDFRSDEVFTTLKTIKESRATISLVYGTLVIDNLVIQSVDSNISSDGGFAKNVTINLKQIRISSSATTTIPRSAMNNINGNVADTAESTTNNGVKSKDAVEDRGTVLLRAIEGLEDFLGGTE